MNAQGLKKTWLADGNRWTQIEKLHFKKTLKNTPGYAAKYLAAAAADSTEALLVALRDVGSARKGLTRLAEAAEVNRVSLYQMLSKERNPGIRNIRAILDALELEIRIVDKRSDPYEIRAGRVSRDVRPVSPRQRQRLNPNRSALQQFHMTAVAILELNAFMPT